MQPRRVHPEGLTTKDLGDEFIVFDVAEDRVHVLNSTARMILLLCDGARTVEDLAMAFAETYRLDEATARKDVTDTLAQLLDLGLIDRS